MVQLPASKKCFQVFVLSGKEKEYSPEECERIKRRSVILTPKTWKAIRSDIHSNCQFAKCKQLTGAMDSIFLVIDNALDKTMP